MSKKAQALKSGPPRRRVLYLGQWLAVLLSVALFVLSSLGIKQYSLSTGSSESAERIRVLGANKIFGNPKVAFLFLTRRNLPLDFLWQSFFENAESAYFSVYVHSAPGFVLNESTTGSAVFFDRQLKGSVKVSWGEASMIQAERLLFQESLKDPANQRFVLLSDSCIPLYNFSSTYSYLMRSPRSFVDSFRDEKDAQYNPLMSPVISKEKWRKGSQWIALIRKHAEVVAGDEIAFPAFKMFCKRRPPVDARLGRQNLIQQKLHNCIPDEHYVQTLLSMSGLESELERRTVTFSMWNHSKTNTEKETWHPFTFSFSDSSPQLIKQIRGIDHVNYRTEHRTEWCKNNSTSVSCFIFARKFSQAAAMRLMSQGLLIT